MSIFSTVLGTAGKFDPKALGSSPFGSTSIPKVLQSTPGKSTDALKALTGEPKKQILVRSEEERQALLAIQNQSTTADQPEAVADDSVQGEEIVVTGTNDHRLRISPQSYEQVLGKNDPQENIMSILWETNGLLFPYTPNVTVSQSVNWDPMALVHTNFDFQNYQRTPSVSISVSGAFTAQNQREGEYVMAVIHFLRVVTKSYFGVEDAQNELAGIPPPVLMLQGFGTHIFKRLPVVIKSYNYTFDENMDATVFYSRNNESARLNAKMMISVELAVQTNLDKQRNQFSLDEYRTGKLKGFY